jgi:hypothetical protein
MLLVAVVRLVAEKVDGAMPNEHCIMPPVQQWFAIPLS